MKTAGAVDLKKRTLTKSAALLFASAPLGRLGTVLALSDSSQGRLEEMPDRPWADPASLVSSIARTAQFSGPSGERLIFAQDLLVDRSKQIGSINVGGIYIQMLAAAPYTQTRDFYLKTLAMQLSLEVDVPRSEVTDTFGMDSSGLYKMSAVRAPQYCSIIINQYPDVMTPRPSVPGYFPSGLCMCTFSVRDLDLVDSTLRQADVSFARMDSNSIPPFVGDRALACRGHTGEFVEFIEYRTG